ncbi:hypothetical protein DF19_06040 [Streptomyces olindensis]|nr:hypothetical protein DF19_06040 [Streptomyces olindensis]
MRSSSAASKFSWMRWSLREPGMGTMKSFLCSIQASEICAGVAPLWSAKLVRRSTRGWLARTLSLWKRVMTRRASSPV